MVTIAEIWAPIAQYGIWGLVGVAILFFFVLIAGAFGIWKYQKNKWYLTVGLKMPRDGSKTIVAEMARGLWYPRKATMWVKRKGLFGSKFFVKMDDISKYLQGSDFIELIGSGIDWKPILYQSYTTMVNEETGQEASIMKYRMNFAKDKAWAIAAEREFIDTFSLSDVFNKLKDYIGWGLVIGIVILAEVVRVAYVGG